MISALRMFALYMRFKGTGILGGETIIYLRRIPRCHFPITLCTNIISYVVASQFVITFQFVIKYYKLERICNAIASQFVINYYKLERICTAAASQFVISYYKLARICTAFAFKIVIKYYISDDTQRTLVTIG